MIKKEQFDLTLGENQVYKKEKKSQGVTRSHGQNTWYYLGLVGDIGFTIAIPIAGGAILGRYIDSLTGTYPKGTLSFLVVGIIISGIGFAHTIKEIIQKKR